MPGMSNEPNNQIVNDAVVEEPLICYFVLNLGP